MLPSPYFRCTLWSLSLDFANPSLIWSYHLALKSEIVLELSNIPVVRDFPNIFSEVLPGCRLTAMLSSWPSWFSYKSLLLQESVLDIPELVGWARQQLGELGDKSLSDLVHVKGYLLVCVCVEERWYLHRLVLVISCWIYCLVKTLIWVWAIIKSNQNQRCS